MDLITSALTIITDIKHKFFNLMRHFHSLVNPPDPSSSPLPFTQCHSPSYSLHFLCNDITNYITFALSCNNLVMHKLARTATNMKLRFTY